MDPAIPERPLRILCVINLPWDLRLGAPRVWMELAEHWRAAGHSVDWYSLEKAFPKPTAVNAIGAIRQVWFPRRALHFIRSHGQNYDVIDSLLGTLPFPKSRLGFRGLLVARSVGFYWLYEKFDRYARQRWPDLSRGKFVGRLLYTLIRRHLLTAAEIAICHSDLLNLPNEDELKLVREDVGSDKPAVIEPYGLSEEQQRRLAEAARSPQTRLAANKISFIGMWSVRKGAKDWREIVRRVRMAVPEATFCFLGTLTDKQNVLHDLGDCSSRCEIISEYEPAALPQLLSDCTVGIFPSYAEGFGFAVLEQLAARIPVVAYDVPGPRQILEPLRGALLVPAGNVGALSQNAVTLLRMSSEQYAALAERSASVAAQYSWPQIASATIHAYREHRKKKGGPIVFTQPFGWRSPGGGARILRAVLQDAPLPVELVCTSPQSPPAQNEMPEFHLPLRPSLGRLERSRFAGKAHATAPLFARKFARRLEQHCLNRDARAIHSIAHAGMDFYHAFLAAEKSAIPFFLHVHDDFIYSARWHGHEMEAPAALRCVWQKAALRFVIGERLGEEYCSRYGRVDYTVITDGLEHVAAAPRRREPGKLRLYFMGLFHLEYEPNLRVLLESIAQLRRENLEITMTLRCDSLPRNLLRPYRDFIRVLPFADETEVERDLQTADLLFLPLPFDAAHESFVRFSLSTKVITYLGSGVPILYHGPKASAVCELLHQHQAALLNHSLQANDLLSPLRVFAGEGNAGHKNSENALELARAKFLLSEIRQRFWSAIARALSE